MSEDQDFEYFKNKKPGKTYVSKRIQSLFGSKRPIRLASKVVDSENNFYYAKEKGKLVIRTTEGKRKEIIAKFFEDNRGISVLTIQSFNGTTGDPQKIHFSFVGNEIKKLLEFISDVRAIDFPDERKINVTDAELQKLLLSPEQMKSMIIQNQEQIISFVQNNITSSDIIALGYRKEQLFKFEQLLTDITYFNQCCTEEEKSPEALWQSFFEKNQWIFGYGLSLISLNGLTEKKLEQTVLGKSLLTPGKRVDGLMKTRGLIESICFVEIKKHTTPLLADEAYRSGCWPPSDELIGGISQSQGSAELAIRHLEEKIEPTLNGGTPTGEKLFTIQPRSYLIVGSLEQFNTDFGPNVEKFRSFELFRRNMVSPEIITYDELFERARFIVETTHN